MAYIGKTPTPAPLTSSDIAADIINSTHIGDTAISGFDALATAPADTDEFLISDAGVLKRLDASLIGGGKIGQVVQTHFTTQSQMSSSSFAAITGCTVDITPSATSSKILLIHSANVQAGAAFYGYYTIYRDSTDISESHADRGLGSLYSSQGTQALPMHFSKLDSPSTTSQITYTVQFKSSNGTAMHYGEPDGTTTSLIAIYIGE